MRRPEMGSLTVTEQIYLIAIWHLKENAYGVKIREKILELTGKSMVFGTLYNNLDTLVKKGYVETKRGSSGPNRGGNIRVFYNLTKDGERSLQESRELQRSLWESVPESAFMKR
jgi:DNA-binding PadR family transcriptional regulator